MTPNTNTLKKEEEKHFLLNTFLCFALIIDEKIEFKFNFCSKLIEMIRNILTKFDFLKSQSNAKR